MFMLRIIKMRLTEILEALNSEQLPTREQLSKLDIDNKDVRDEIKKLRKEIKKNNSARKK